MLPYPKLPINSNFRLPRLNSTSILPCNCLNIIRAVLLAPLSIALVILLGCNVESVQIASNSSSSTTTVASSPAPAAPTPVDYQALLTSFQPLTGCSNPNTGTATGDWGTEVPVYTNPSLALVYNNYPTYASNTIFWTSRETAPGQSVLMTGAFTNSPKTVRIARIPAGTSDWQSLVRNSTVVVSAIQQGTTGLSFIVPSSFSAGVYGFQIEDPSSPSVISLANVPSLSWVVGVPASSDPSTAVQAQIHDCGAEPGETLRLFGKNFTSSSQVILQSSTGAIYILTPTKQDTNSIAALVPAGLASGEYSIWIGSSPWSVVSSSASHITIYSSPTLTVHTVSCSGLVGDGVTDNTTALQLCLDSNKPATASSKAVEISIPAGTFALKGGVRPHPYQVMVGASTTSTKFIGVQNSAMPSAWFTVPSYFGMANLSLEAPSSSHLLVTSGYATSEYKPEDSGHLFFSNVDFRSISASIANPQELLGVGGPDIQIYNSYFQDDNAATLGINMADGAIISGNTFVLNNSAIWLQGSQNVIFENNNISSSTLAKQWPNGIGMSGTLSISRAFSQFGSSTLSQNIYTGYNQFANLDSSNNQIITTDGGAGAYYGPITSSTADTVTLAGAPGWNWTGTTNPGAASIAIIAGTGVGQYSIIKSIDGQAISLANPWKVSPDKTSIVVISAYQLNLTLSHNKFTDTRGTTINLGSSLEGVIEDNTLVNSGDGILLWAYGPYGGPAAYPPTINNDIIRNSIEIGAGNLIRSSVTNNIGGIGVLDMPGCLVSGMLIRDNSVASLQTIFSTNGANGVSATLIEQNQANPFINVTVSGFLVQDNIPVK